MGKSKITEIQMKEDSTLGEQLSNSNSCKSLSNLFKSYGAVSKGWIYFYTYIDIDKGKIEKHSPNGINQNWTKNDCSNKMIGSKEYKQEHIVIEWCMAEVWDIRNTKLAIFDDDNIDKWSHERSIQEYPFLKGCYYQKGNTKGFHYIVENDEFVNAKKDTSSSTIRDFITDTIWCKDDKLYGDKIISLDTMIVKQQFPKFNTSNEQLEKVIKTKTNDDVGEVIIKESKTDKFLVELLDNIKLEYCESFQEWFDIVRALKGTNNIDYIDYFSKRCSSKYKDGKYYSTINSATGNNFSIGTIYHYSKLSDSKNHFDILDKFNKIPIKPYDELGDIDYADIFLSITDEVFYHSTRECYYGYNSNNYTWVEKKKEFMLELTSLKLGYYLNNELRKIYFKMSNLEVCTNIDKTCNCKTCSTKETYSKQIKQMEKNIKYCKSATNTKHIIDYIFDKLKNIGIDIQMDSNPYLFCWNNKTYDIENKKFVKRNKYDYITTTTGYDYDEPSIDYKGEINELMSNIFSNEEVANCFFSVCRSGLTAVLEEKFTLANGSGGNGKGLINYAMKILLGNYFHDVSHSVITKEITGDKPLPEVSKLNGIRYCVISEIKEDSILLEDSIKKLTNNIINARGMYSSITRVINTATYVAECNARPKIQGENGDAMSRRYIDVFFNKKYTNDPDKLLLDGYLQANPMYKTDEYWLPRRIAFFFWLLKFNETIYEPPIVKQRSKDFLKECNIPLMVFEGTIEKCKFDKTKNTLITTVEFLGIVRRSEEFTYLEKQEKKLYTKNKMIDFFKNTFFDDYKKKQNIKIPNETSFSNCIIGYRLIKNNDCEIDED